MTLHHGRRVLAGLVSILCLCAGVDALAQRLYDKQRDDQAQTARKQAEEIASGSLFEKQVKNLSALSKRDFATYFLGARRNMRAGIQMFNTWNDVKVVVDRAARAVGAPSQVTDADIAKAQSDLQARLKAARDALAALKAKARQEGDKELTALFERLGDFESLLDYADRLVGEKDRAKLKLSSIRKVTDTVDILRKVYESYNAKIDRIGQLKGNLVALKAPLLRVAVQRLQLEEQHWKTLGAIEARRRADQDELRFLIADYRALTTRTIVPMPPGDEEITYTFRSSVKTYSKVNTESGRQLAREQRERLLNLMLALHDAAALAARGSTPYKLAELRTAQEQHLYSIKQSAIIARAYEAVVSTGVQRLALYHQGGVKPELIAQVIHTAATVAIPAAILGK